MFTKIWITCSNYLPSLSGCKSSVGLFLHLQPTWCWLSISVYKYGSKTINVRNSQSFSIYFLRKIQTVLKRLKVVKVFSYFPTSTLLKLSKSKLNLPSEEFDFEIKVFSEWELSFDDEFPLFHLLNHRINRCSTITYLKPTVLQVSMNFGVTPTFFVEFPYLFSYTFPFSIFTFVLMNRGDTWLN